MDSLIVANVKQRPLRTAVSVIGVALGVILVVLTVGLAHGMMRDATERQSNVDAEIRFFASGTLSFTANPLMLREAFADAILNGVQPTAEDPDLKPIPPIPGVASVSPVGEWVQTSGGGLGFEMIDGVDYESFAKTTQIKIVEGRPLGDGRATGTEFQAIVDPYYAENNQGTDGKPIRVGSKIKILDHEFDVVGIYQPSMLARVKIPLPTMQELLGGAENCTFVLVKTESPEMEDQVMASLKQYYPSNRAIFTRDLPALYSQGFNAVDVFLNVVIWLSMVISTLVILLAMYTTIIERTREIGILKSLGAPKRFIVMSIEKEAAMISALGVAFGFCVAIIGKYGIEASTRLHIDLQFEWLLIAALIGLMGGIIGALYPAWRAANLDPIEALSYE
jgi:putative ABC transport system permease protein